MAIEKTWKWRETEKQYDNRKQAEMTTNNRNILQIWYRNICVSNGYNQKEKLWLLSYISFLYSQ